MTDAPPPPPAAHRELMASPVDLDGQVLIGGRPLLWATLAILTAALFLALTNAIAIDGWAAELPPSEMVARLNDLTARWRAMTDGIGLGAPRAGVHGAWQRGQAARFPGQASPAP